MSYSMDGNSWVDFFYHNSQQASKALRDGKVELSENLSQESLANATLALAFEQRNVALAIIATSTHPDGTYALDPSVVNEAQDQLKTRLAFAQPEVQANSKPNQNFEVVNSVEELEALPVQSVIEDDDGSIFEIIHNGEQNSDGTFYREYLMTGEDHPYTVEVVRLPATVLKRAPETPRR